MSNHAALIDVLAVAGSRLSDGEPNASGTVYLFEPGGNTPVNGYSDAAATTVVTQPITLTAGGTLNTTDFPNGLYVTQPVRLLVQDVDGTTVVDTVYIPATAGDVGVDNDGFTDSNLDDVLTDAFTSFGGTDWKYKESGGATERTIKAKFAEIWISVKDFGAVGDGVAIDTTAIQSAISRVKALGGGTVWFPAGTYSIDQALTLTSGTGVAFRGAGVSATKIITSNTTANVFTLSSCTSTIFEGFGISATGTNSASAISLTSCTTVTLRQILVSTFGGGTFLIPIVSATSSTLRLEDCRLTAKAADATARGLKLTSVSGVFISGGLYSGLTGAAIELAGSTSFVQVFGASFGASSANIGILWTAAMTGTDFTVVGCPTLRSAIGTVTTPFDLSALTTDPRFRQWGNEVEGYASVIATGTTQTPDRARGDEITYSVTSGGAGTVTIISPTPVPSSVMRGVTLTLKLVNALGGAAAVTWAMSAAIWKLVGAVAPLGTDGTTTTIKFIRDVDGAMWRELCRSNTAT